MVPPEAVRIDVAAADPAWPDLFARVAEPLRAALGARAPDIAHVGSTAVPGLDAKPVIDIDLIVADSSDEEAWLPALEGDGLVLTVREPWWHEHRMLRLDAPRANIHVFGPDAPEPWRHRIFRDHLRRCAADRELYAAATRAASASSNAAGEAVMDYNRRKQDVVREIYGRAFTAAGLR